MTPVSQCPADSSDHRGAHTSPRRVSSVWQSVSSAGYSPLTVVNPRQGHILSLVMLQELLSKLEIWLGLMGGNGGTLPYVTLIPEQVRIDHVAQSTRYHVNEIF